MSKHIVVAVDSDKAFLERFKARLDELGVLNELNIKPILTKGTTAAEIADNCLSEVKKLLESGSSVDVVFVDIVIIEGRMPVDQSGLHIAAVLSSAFPNLPIIGMTVHFNDHRLLSEISFDPCIQGVLLKAFFEDVAFQRRDFFSIIERAKSRLQNQWKWGKSMPEAPKRTEGTTKKQPEGRFQLGDDPQTQFQVLEIDKQVLSNLLEQIFPDGSGTVSSLRPGFSGSFLFKVQVASTPAGISRSGTRTWVVKVMDREDKLRTELKAMLYLKSRVDREFYPPLFSDALTTFDGWSALALAIAEDDAVTFYEYLQRQSRAEGATSLLRNSLFTFLTALYGSSIPNQAYVWHTYFGIEPRTTAGISTFLDQAHVRVKRHLGSRGVRALDRIEKFVRSNGTSEKVISQIESTVDTRYIHGDLNSRNLLVPSNAGRFVFIDFARSKQDHCMKDIAKLETDLLLLSMDSRGWDDTEWDAIDEWQKVFELYGHGNLFPATNSVNPRGLTKPVTLVAKLIRELRRGLRALLGETLQEDQYTLALLHYALRYLSYPDISLPKKIFEISYIEKLFNSLP